MNGLHPIMAKALAPWMPKYPMTSCSQCGKDTGPGDHGFSHCIDHGDDPRDLLLLEEDDDLNPDKPDADESICPTCSGSGEGRYENTTCHACGGSGVHHG